MRALPAFELAEEYEDDGFDPVVVRTDYADDEAWRATVAGLRSPWGEDGEAEARFHLIDDPCWDGAGVEEVVRAAGVVENLVVLFLADAVTMRSPSRPLLALDLFADEGEDLDPAYYQELIDNPPVRAFRTVPGEVHAVQVNLALANVDFQEFAAMASEDPEGVLRTP
ncbi:hypothetical protein [Streptomyces sp. NBC_00102]|uniref:DUF6924 domain-containing protein n=1 Tax=Streptomyces sp. NBC_00102 TaxID=2975652 RepID=UPI00224FDE31|nr:hypothetical protein [Streptomyces sp. NBC_00102]MCX5397700.1 hypothetical protein [Streptomyces sp. NBC_00102]